MPSPDIFEEKESLELQEFEIMSPCNLNSSPDIFEDIDIPGNDQCSGPVPNSEVLYNKTNTRMNPRRGNGNSTIKPISFNVLTSNFYPDLQLQGWTVIMILHQQQGQKQIMRVNMINQK